jgi:hypothetical protein
MLKLIASQANFTLHVLFSQARHYCRALSDWEEVREKNKDWNCSLCLSNEMWGKFNPLLSVYSYLPVALIQTAGLPSPYIQSVVGRPIYSTRRWPFSIRALSSSSTRRFFPLVRISPRPIASGNRRPSQSMPALPRSDLISMVGNGWPRFEGPLLQWRSSSVRSWSSDEEMRSPGTGPLTPSRSPYIRFVILSLLQELRL